MSKSNQTLLTLRFSVLLTHMQTNYFSSLLKDIKAVWHCNHKTPLTEHQQQPKPNVNKLSPTQLLCKCQFDTYGRAVHHAAGQDTKHSHMPEASSLECVTVYLLERQSSMTHTHLHQKVLKMTCGNVSIVQEED